MTLFEYEYTIPSTIQHRSEYEANIRYLKASLVFTGSILSVIDNITAI